jgi:hypothetical protein
MVIVNLGLKRLISIFLFYVSGFLSWDSADSHVNLEEELKTITSQGLEGEEGKHGKFVVCYIIELVERVCVSTLYI